MTPFNQSNYARRRIVAAVMNGLCLAAAILGLIVLGLSPAFGKAKEEFLAYLSILFVVVTGALSAFVAAAPARQAGPILSGMFVVDNFALFFQFAILLSLVLTLLASMRFVTGAPATAAPPRIPSVSTRPSIAAGGVTPRMCSTVGATSKFPDGACTV